MSLGSQVRKYRLQLGLTLEELEKRSGVARGTISALENRGSNKSEYARQLATALGLSLEQLADESKDWSLLSVREEEAEYVGAAPKQALIAVSGLAQLGENGWYEEVTAPGTEGYVEASSSDPDAYVLRVKGDSMHPAIRNGWYVVVEPNRSPCAGEYAAILLQDGRRMVKEFLFQSNSGVSVESVNGGARLSLKHEEIKSMHAIGSVLMPSKHRDV